MSANSGRFKQQRGFTFIELVAVIVLISFLAAIAAPRFFDQIDNAQAASLQGTAGGFSTGVAIAKAKWITQPGDFLPALRLLRPSG